MATGSPLRRVGLALADPARQQILLALLDGPARPSELLIRLPISKTNLSNHLACLRGCGLIVGAAQGRSIMYRLVSDDLDHALRDLLRLESRLCPHDSLDRLVRDDEQQQGQTARRSNAVRAAGWSTADRS
jgi:ArsR family transcriptional regulator, cadmium/lead-responsive transcriptional repressor